MGFTRNGWLGSSSPSDFGGLDNRVVPGSTAQLIPGVRAGDVANLIFLFSSRFHTEVESLVKGWCWGYAYRAVRAGAALSEHSAAVAWDLNAPRHPLGKRGTFTGGQVAAIRRLLADFSDSQGPVIRWGGDFSRPDEMHFEIIGSLTRVRNLVARLTQPGAPVRPPITTPDTPTTPVGEEDDMYDQNARNELVKRLDDLAWLVNQVKGNADRLPAIQGATDKLSWGVLDPGQGLRAMVAGLAGRDIDTVDEAELARQLAPLVAEHLSGLSAEDVAKLAEAVADEQARRMAE